MKAIYMVLLAMVFLIPLVSAFEFDNRLTYEDEDMTGVITNAFGLGKEIGRATLSSHSSPTEIRNVIRGKDRVVMYYDFKFDEIYQDGLGEVIFIDERTGKEIEKDYHFVKEVYTYSTYNTYEDVCSDIYNDVNKTWDNVCVKNITGTEEVKRGSWEKIGNDVPKGEVRIGLATDVDSRDYIDGIWKIAGLSINKHSSWTESLNAGLVAYYNFNDSTDNVAGRNNLTNWEGTPTYSSSNCLIGDCGQVSINNNFGLEQTTYMNTSMSYTMNFWARYTSASQVYATYLGIENNLALIGHDVSQIWYHRDVWTGTAVVQGAPTLFDQWYMITIVRDQSNNNVTIYQNGTQINKMGFAGGSGTSGNTNGQFDTWTLGSHWQYSDREMVGQYDEMGFWNRTLSGAEIQQLFNNNSGITYKKDFLSLDLVYPTNTTYSDTIKEMNYTQEGHDYCWYSLNSGTNSTPVTAGVNFTGLNSGGGSSTWRVYCNDSANAITSDVVTFFVDVGVETFLKSPADALSTTDTTIEFEVNASASGSARLRNQTIYLYYSNSTLLTTNYSTISGLTSSRKFNYTFADGSYIWNAITEANSSSVFLNDWDTNRTFTVDSTAPIITITYPTTAIDFHKVNNNLRINWTVSDVTAGLDLCWIEYQSVNTTVTCNNNGTFINITNSGDKSATFYANDTLGNQNSNSFNWSYKLFWNSETFNTTVYESQTQSYILNMSSTGDETVTANFTFNGTNYTTTKEGTNTQMNFTFSHDLPIGVGTFNFSWNVFYGSDIINTTPQSQTVDILNLSLCGLGGLNTPFLNFTAKDEATDLPLNFTVDIADWTYYYLGAGEVFKTYSFLNVSANTSNYAFCATPNLTIQQSLEVKYSDFAGDYPLRTYKTLDPMSNTTTNTVLYLLKATDGQYVTFQVLSGSGSPIQNVVANASREIPQGSGNVVLIGSGLTDASGAITYFVNPDFSHTFTFDGTSLGLPKRIETITPSKTEYTIYLSERVAPGNLTTYDFTRGMTYLVSPRLNYLQNGTFYEFNFTLNASYWAVTRYGFTLLNGSGTVLGYNDSTSLSLPPVLNISTEGNTSIRMEYFWLVTGNYTNGTRTWGVFAEDDKGFGLNRFFTDFLAYSNAGVFGLNDFSRTLIIFLVIFLTIGAITMLSGLYSPGAILIQLFALVYFFDVVLGLIINPPGAIPHFATIITLILAIGYAVREVTR